MMGSAVIFQYSVFTVGFDEMSMIYRVGSRGPGEKQGWAWTKLARSLLHMAESKMELTGKGQLRS